MPTIVDSLIVKLGLDSKDLVSKGGSADKTLKSLEGSSKSTEGSVKKLGESMKTSASSVDSLTKSIGSFLAVLGGSAALVAFIKDTISSNAELDRLSKNLGVSVENVSAWGNAVEELGGTAKGLQGTLSMLTQSQTELRLTGQSALIPYFSSLGVAMAGVGGKARPVDDILVDLADKFSKLDRPTANNLGHMMGIDQGTLNLLLLGRKEVELTLKRQKEHNVVTKAQAEESAKLQKSLIGLRQSFTALGRDLLQQASPAIEKFLSILTAMGNWVQNNREFIGDLAKILGAVAAGLGLIALASSPITLTVAAVVALGAGIAALWQDYQNWKRGGDSLIDWAKWKPGIDAAIAGVRDLGKALEVVANSIGIVKKLIGGDSAGANAQSAQLHSKIMGWMGLKDNASPSDVLHAVVGGVSKPVKATRANIKTANGQQVDSAYAMQYFQSRGFSAAAAAGLASQIHSESSGNAGAVGDHGAAYGLIQWHKDRQDNFKKFKGKDIRQSSVDDQLDFIVHELNSGTERGAGAKLKAAGSAEQAGEIASKYYVRPGDVQGEAMRRGAYAAQISGVGGASANVARAGSPAGGSGGGASVDKSMSIQTGNIIINSPTNDPAGHARDFAKSLNYSFTAQANSGLN